MQLLKKLRSFKLAFCVSVFLFLANEFSANAQQNSLSQQIKWNNNPLPNNLFVGQTFFSEAIPLPAICGVMDVNQSQIVSVEMLVEEENLFAISPSFQSEKLKNTYETHSIRQSWSGKTRRHPRGWQNDRHLDLRLKLR